MRPRDQRDVIDVIELLDNVGAKEEARATGRETPSRDLVRIAPEQVAHCAFMRDFLFAIDEANLVKAVDERGEAAVDAEDSATG